MIKALKKLDSWVQKILRLISMAIFSALGLLMVVNVLLRLTTDLINFLSVNGYVNIAEAIKNLLPVTSFHWFDEIVELSFAALVFYGAAALWGAKLHFSVGDWITPRLPNQRLKILYKMFIYLICMVFMGILFWFSMRLTLRSTELTTVFQIKKSVLYSCMPISALIMLIYSIFDFLGTVMDLFSGEPSQKPSE
ncbi:TRAP transporter small permease [Desulforhopalus sp. IMCC35007]|uniref:TRAP transporter small permease n=1 Tax=Desulforhopalus sp. IMCC35007 TaxID=2569543 RepID=UPI0010ADD827|nr:TRAP transporter small permease [Desulforhopalus sp. IMCC35007]TKB09614.1 TRAP transporter small permease [Desulforhopalus sp. IMCC35007]